MATDWLLESLSIYYDLATDGFPVTVRTVGDAGTFNPATLTYTGSTPDVDVIIYGLFKNYATSEKDGTRIQYNDMKLIVASYGLITELTPSHQILINGVVQNVVSVRRIAPANITICYELQVRG